MFVAGCHFPLMLYLYILQYLQTVNKGLVITRRADLTYNSKKFVLYIISTAMEKKSSQKFSNLFQI